MPSLNTGSFMEHRRECFGDHSKVGGVGELSTKECQCGKCSLAWLLLTLLPLSFHWWRAIQPLVAGICLSGGQVVKQLKPYSHQQCPLWKLHVLATPNNGCAGCTLTPLPCFYLWEDQKIHCPTREKDISLHFFCVPWISQVVLLDPLSSSTMERGSHSWGRDGTATGLSQL